MLFPSFTVFFLAQAAQHVFANPVAPHVLGADDVIVMGEDGKTSIMKDFEYADLQRRAVEANKAVMQRATELAERSVTGGDETRKNRRHNRNNRRGCEESSEVQVLTDEHFLNWDVAMSPVVGSQGSKDPSVTITKGHSISNTLETSASVGVGIEDILSISFSVSYSETWTTEESTSFIFTIPENQFGLIVSQPSVRRMTGYYYSGCTDNWDKESFTSDTYTNQNYGDMLWPTGVIRLCNSTQYPIPYCIGNGEHY